MGIFSSKPDYSKIRTKKVKEKEEKEKKVKPAWVKWVKFSIVAILWLLFIYWLGSWWGLIVLPFIFDAYITKKINWTWWKKEDQPASNFIMSWVDAIVFALVAVYFVNNFFFQNYKIPSSSLEKSLLTGDYLLVSKLSYGPRIPMTPLTLPLTQHTIPGINCKSYIEWPQWEYRRAKGFGTVQLGDIVVFNYPSGDTVAVNYPNDFYALCFETGCQIASERSDLQDLLTTNDTTTVGQIEQFNKLYALGKEGIKQNQNRFGKITTRPVDRRENYVKRCVGLPGQTFQIKDKVIYINGEKQPFPELVQFNYKVYTKDGGLLDDKLCADLGISDEDRNRILDYTHGMALTFQAKAALEKMPEVIDSIVEIKDGYFGRMYPIDHEYGWTRDNYGPIVIPAKGQTIKLDMDNICIYERPIRTYEGNQLDIKRDGIYINGKKSDSYTFTMDYYWMMGDNRHNSEDSRYWGFVPEDHIVGKPLFIWLSISPDNNPEAKTYRWDRLFKWVGNIK